MAKWAYTTNRKPKALLQFPPISRLGEETLHHNNKEKATILIEHFFPLPVEVDFSDILGFIYPEPQTTKTKVEEEDIITTLKRLASNKALSLKKILTNFLKYIGSN